jgi:hypothetical protein
LGDEAMPKRINWKLVAKQLVEAREELQRLEEMVASRTARSEGALQAGVEHAYHHINFAWNARRMTDKSHRNLTTRQFQRGSRFPRTLKPIGAK